MFRTFSLGDVRYTFSSSYFSDPPPPLLPLNIEYNRYTYVRFSARMQEQLIRHVGALKARGAEGSGVEGRGGRRRSRSFAGAGPGPGSSRVPASTPSQPGVSSAGGVSAGAGKRKRSLASLSGAGLGSSGVTGLADEGEEGKTAATAGTGAGVEGETEKEVAERERKAEEEQEATVAAARPALIFCRVVDALQVALKSRRVRGDGDGGGSGAALASSAAASIAVGGDQGVLEIFLSGGDDFLLAASRAAHEAYESAIKPLSRGGGVATILQMMGLRDAFARDSGLLEEGRDETGEKNLAVASRERVMNLLCEGELFAVACSRSSV